MTRNWVDRSHYRKILIKVIYLWITVVVLSILTIIATSISLDSLKKEREYFNNEAKLFEFINDYQTELYLSTVQIRSFLITAQPLYFSNYKRSSNKLKSFDNLLKFFQNLHTTPAEIKLLEDAKKAIDEINIIETHALKLLSAAYNVSADLLPEEVNSFILTAEESAKSPEEQLKMAQDLLFDTSYMRQNEIIAARLNAFQSNVEYRLKHNAGKEVQTTNWSLFILIAFLSLQILAIGSIIWLRAVSLRKYVKRI